MAVTQSPLVRALAQFRLVPIIVLPRLELAVPLARLLIEEGLPIVEITCRTPAALPALRLLRDTFADLWVGAGTVLSAAQAEEAVKAGAQFLLSPAYDPATVAAAHALNVPMLPGVMTPTEVGAANAEGLDLLKLFPAAVSGGVGNLRALRSVYPTVNFVPTGGITQANLADYLSEPNVICCGGSWLAPADLLQQERWDEIRVRVRAAVKTASGIPKSA